MVVEELIPEMSQGQHSNVGTVLFVVGFCYVMVLGFHGRLLSIWMGMFLDWVFRSLCFFVRFARGRWMEQSVI